MQSFLPPEDVCLMLEEPAAAAATDCYHCLEDVVVLVRVRDPMAAAEVHQDCQAVVESHQTSLYDHLERLMMVATNHHLEVDYHCCLNRHRPQVEHYHCLEVEYSGCQAARSLVCHCLALLLLSQSSRCHPG